MDRANEFFSSDTRCRHTRIWYNSCPPRRRDKNALPSQTPDCGLERFPPQRLGDGTAAAKVHSCSKLHSEDHDDHGGDRRVYGPGRGAEPGMKGGEATWERTVSGRSIDHLFGIAKCSRGRWKNHEHRSAWERERQQISP